MSNINAYFPVDSNLRELAEHKTDDIPCAAYIDKYFNSSYHWHWHDELEITFVTEGAIEAWINSEHYILNKNDGIFINSGVVHKYGSGIQNADCVMPNVVFHPTFICGSEGSMFKKYIAPIINSTGLSHYVFRADNESDKPFLVHIRSVFQAAENKEWGYEFRLRENLSALFMLLHPFADNDDLPVPNTDTYRIRMMMDYIKKNFFTHITLADIAASVGIGVRDCQRCFEKTLKTTPMRYVNELRIDYAKKLLLETTEEISVICEKCGFNDQSYFTKVFRICVGVPPLRFRKIGSQMNMSQKL